MSLALPQKFNESTTPPLPGQFVSCAFPQFAFRRPFAVSGYDAQTHSFTILYQQVAVCRPYNFIANSAADASTATDSTISSTASTATRFARALDTASTTSSDAAAESNTSTSTNKALTKTTSNVKVNSKENASSMITKLSTGEHIDTMYFHGNHFPLPATNSKAILVAGGIGLGPLLYFQKYLEAHSYLQTLIFGARTQSLIPSNILHRNHTIVCTEDGSAGVQATSIAMLEKLIQQERVPLTIYFCGPLGMMQAGAMLAKHYTITSYASLDCTMACAMGACVACVVPVCAPNANTKDSIEDSTKNSTVPSQNISPTTATRTNAPVWKKACIEGPIFCSEEIIWESLAH